MKRNRELLLSLLAVVLITLLYTTVVILQEVPAASGFVGHLFGVLGFVLMLATETLYSLRKRTLHRPWGRMSAWLQFHIFTGIVGPYLVLLHTAWEFRGLAGVVLLLTGLVVLSGFFGRYIYTAVPRSANGLIVEAQELRAQLAQAEELLKRAGPSLDLLGRSELLGEVQENELQAMFARPVQEMRLRWRLWQQTRGLDPDTKAHAEEVGRLLRRSSELRRQLASLSVARRALATWHTIHIPLGVGLFAAAFIHIGAALYYATLLR